MPVCNPPPPWVDCPVPPCEPPVPPGGDGCLTATWECICPSGTDIWSFVSSVCGPALPCDDYLCTPLLFVCSFPNGCLAGVPLFDASTLDPASPPFFPPCIPSCCGELGCFRYRWECVCTAGPTDIWQLVGAECVDNSDCVGASNWTEKTPQAYADEQLNSCSLGDPVPVAPAPPIAPQCCPGAGECQYLYGAVCRGGVWTVDTGVYQGCNNPCTPDADWVGAGCTRTRVVCSGACDPADPLCSAPPPAPAAPVDIPACCQPATCGMYFEAACAPVGPTPTWTVTLAQKTCSICVEQPWTLDLGDNCLATKVQCSATPCGSTRECPVAAAVPPVPVASPACCQPTYCNCVYQSEYNCLLSAWGTPFLVGLCTDDPTDNAAAWAYTSGCFAETTVSALGPCD